MMTDQQQQQQYQNPQMADPNMMMMPNDNQFQQQQYQNNPQMADPNMMMMPNQNQNQQQQQGMNAQLQQQVLFQQQQQQQQQMLQARMQMMGMNNNNNTNNNGMANPGMPMQQQQLNMMRVQPDFLAIPNMMAQPLDPQTEQLLKMTGSTKLNQVSQIMFKQTKINGCSDQFWCGGFATEHQVHPVQMVTTHQLFKVKHDNPGCLASTVKGEFVAVNYSDTQNHQFLEEKLYDIKHVRKCCALKAVFSWAHVFGLIWFCCCNCYCRPHSELSKEGSTIAKYKYDCCSVSTDILDGNGNLKYSLKASQGQQQVYSKKLFDAQKNEIMGFSHSWNHLAGCKQIIFPPQISNEDDKAMIIYGATKIQ